jgi:hypothetical protein
VDEKQDVDAWRYAEKALNWSGWGSPVGLGLFLVSASACAVLLRYAWVLH